MFNCIKNANLILTVFFSLLVTLIWMPFGFHMGGVLEEWGTLGSFIHNGVFFIADSTSPLAAHYLRPLTIFPHAVAFKLDPNSFFYWHIITILSIFVKGWSLAKISYLRTKNILFALLCGTLFVLYPADTMQLSFRSIHINVAIALVSLALLFYQLSQEKLDKKVSWALFAVSISALISACLMYEASLFLVPFPFLILVFFNLKNWKEEFFNKNIFLFLWILAGIGIVLNLILNVKKNGAYQGAILSGNNTLYSIFVSMFSKVFSIGAFRMYIHSWYEAAIKFVDIGREFSGYFSLLVLIVLVTGYFCKNSTTDVDKKEYFKLAFLGFIMSGLGYLPYIFSNSHTILTQRTYLFAALGAALCVGSLIFSVFRSSKIALVVIFAVTSLLGMGNQYQQFQHYLKIYDYQAHVLSQTVKLIPDVSKTKNILILDATGKMNDVWMLKSPLLQGALSYVYGQDVIVDVCVVPENKWSSFVAKANTSLGSCSESESFWLVGQETSGAKKIMKSETHIIKIDIDDEVLPILLHTPQVANEDLKKRFSGVFKCDFESKCSFLKSPDKNTFEYDFGGYWGMDVPVPGVGWRSIEWSPNYFDIGSFCWKNETEGVLVFDVKVFPGKYHMSLKIFNWINESVKKSLKIKINDKDLDYSWNDDKLISATIEDGILKNRGNKIVFTSLMDEKEGVSLAFDWIKVFPEGLLP
jgi:hypothetical protein